MKQIITLVCILFMSAPLFCQAVETMKSSMSLGSQTAYYVTVEGADKDMLEDLWKDYVKEYGKSKENKKAKEQVSDKVSVPLINGTSLLTLYAKHEEGKGQATTYLWVDLGGAFANPTEHQSQSEGVEKFLSDFWIVARKKVVQKEVDAEEKKLEQLNKEMRKLQDKNKDYHEEIEKCKKKIMEMENNITTNEKDQELKRTNIDGQKMQVQKTVDKLNSIGKN